MRCRITARGLHPVVSAAYRFASLYLYGAVQPTGQSFFLELPALTSSLFLSALLTTRLQHYSPARVRSLTGVPDLLAATLLANGYSS